MLELVKVKNGLIRFPSRSVKKVFPFLSENAAFLGQLDKLKNGVCMAKLVVQRT